MNEKTFQRLFFIVQMATVAVFLGRAWQHLFWDAPYRALLWDENWMKWIVEDIFKTPWGDYVYNSDSGIQIFTKMIGVFYIICALAAAMIKRWSRFSIILLYIGAFSLIFLAALYAKERFFHAGQFFEYTLQWGSPILLVVLHRRQILTQQVVFFVKIAIALTFICHGLYAIGYYPRPGGFLEMAMNILHITDAQAAHFLFVAGIMDFAVSILIFLPNRIAIGALAYCIIWGFFTTIARVWAHFYIEFLPNVFLQWLHESVMRFPHFLIPLAVLLWQWNLYRQDLRQPE